jgi:hypothetical protein
VFVGDETGAPRTLMSATGMGLTTYTNDGSIEWSPSLANLTPAEQKHLKELLPKLPR